MIERFSFEFSEISFLGVIILAVLLALLMKIVNRALISRLTSHWIKDYYLLFEVAIWILFSLWSINAVLKDSFYHMVTVLSGTAILVIWLGWFVARDLIAGLVLRFTDNFHAGQNFRLQQLDGTIKQVRILGLSLQQSDGNIIEIPWSKISGQIYLKGSGDDRSNQHRFNIAVPRTFSMNLIQSMIREAVLLSVGAALNKEPQIQLTSSGDQVWEFEITVHALSPEYSRAIEMNVRWAFSPVPMKAV